MAGLIVKLKFLDGKIIDFLYSGYSDLIDSLAPYNVEGFTLEIDDTITTGEFQDSYKEYLKYVDFKNYLREISINPEMWTEYGRKRIYERILSVINYNLSKRFFEMLFIQDTPNDREFIKRFQNYDPFVSLLYQPIETKTNVPPELHFYYILKMIPEDIFIASCENGHLEIAKVILHLTNINIHYKNDLPFYVACVSNQLEIAQWIFSVDSVNFDSESLLKVLVKKRIFRVAKWLYLIKPIDLNRPDIFIVEWLCRNGELDILKWLFANSLRYGGINVHKRNDIFFRWACGGGNLEVAKWLYSFGGVNIHSEEDDAFCMACENSHLHVAKWLYRLDPTGFLNPENMDYDMIQWINLLDPIIKEWIISLI